MPKDELWQLYCAAYEQYQSEIINGEKSYSRYVNDFYYYHIPAMNMSESDARVHIMNVCGLKELLENRRDLVDAFFSKDKFEEKDYQQMFHLFDSGQSLTPDEDCLARFSDKQICLITHFANDVSLFKNAVTDSDIKDLFKCQLTRPLQAGINRHVALFFGALRSYGLLPFRWQMIIEENKLIASSANNEPLRASQLRCGLSQAKNVKLAKMKSSNYKIEDLGFETICENFVKKLKESM